jgi:hypothetical protein
VCIKLGQETSIPTNAIYRFPLSARIPFKIPLPDKSSNADTTPSSSSTPPTLSLAGGKLSFGETSAKKEVPSSHLSSLNDLLASPYAALVLSKLDKARLEVESLIKEEMRMTHVPPKEGPCGMEWGIFAGFHAVPSMETVHLHVSGLRRYNFDCMSLTCMPLVLGYQ